MKIITVLRGLAPILQALVDAEPLPKPPHPTGSKVHQQDIECWYEYYSYLLQQVRAMQDWWKRYLTDNDSKLSDWSKDATSLYKQRSINKATLDDMVQHIHLIDPPSPPPYQTTFKNPFTDISNSSSRFSYARPVAV
ncbi:hypothetical protein FRC03_006916 [Tulasnella sp. 419]|nr:hypothetical protein FRC03_006916 [Tulasnella sp. 419]